MGEGSPKTLAATPDTGVLAEKNRALRAELKKTKRISADVYTVEILNARVDC